MSKPLTWDQALALAAKTEAKKSTVNNYAAVELGRQLGELQQQARPAKDIYTSRLRIRTALAGATSKDLERVIYTAQQMLNTVKEMEALQQQADLFKCKLYNIWQADPQGITFEQFLESIK